MHPSYHAGFTRLNPLTGFAQTERGPPPAISASSAMTRSARSASNLSKAEIACDPLSVSRPYPPGKKAERHSCIGGGASASIRLSPIERPFSADRLPGPEPRGDKRRCVRFSPRETVAADDRAEARSKGPRPRGSLGSVEVACSCRPPYATPAASSAFSKASTPGKIAHPANGVGENKSR